MQLVLIVVGLYMVAMLSIGIIFSKKSTDSASYFLSGRSLPSFVLIFTFAATWIGASATLGKSGLAYTSGLSAISPTIGSFIAFFIFTFFWRYHLPFQDLDGFISFISSASVTDSAFLLLQSLL